MMETLFPSQLVSEHQFYKNLIWFVLDAKAPILCRMDDNSERGNMSIYYNFIMLREEYRKRFALDEALIMESLYALHEFCHMLFYYPYDSSSVPEKEFTDIIINGEYAASNETEILIHYRQPRLRKQVFQDKRLFFDMLRERYVTQPTLQNCFKLRKLIIETSVLDTILFSAPEDKEVLRTFKSYQSNRQFCKDFYTNVLSVERAEEYCYRFLTRDNYERVITCYHEYRSINQQEQYERLILMNIRLGCAVLRIPLFPSTFDECFDVVKEMEDRVMFLKS